MVLLVLRPVVRWSSGDPVVRSGTHLFGHLLLLGLAPPPSEPLAEDVAIPEASKVDIVPKRR